MCLFRFFVLIIREGIVKVKYIKFYIYLISFEESKYLLILDYIKLEIIIMLVLKILINIILDKVREKFSDRNNCDDLIDMKYYYLIDRKIIYNLK